MGHDGFGQFAYSKNIITYNISPFEQKAFAGVTSNGFLNMWRRFSTKALISLPPLVGKKMRYLIGKKNIQFKK